jgi:glycoprotein-N-acetylgalactosamine 3-beta-galactosyltransferase
MFLNLFKSFFKTKNLIKLAIFVLWLQFLIYTHKKSSYILSRSFYSLETRPTIFCVVLAKEKELFTKAKLMYDSWVHKCDDYRFISTIPKEYLPNNSSTNLAVDIDIGFKVLQPQGFRYDSFGRLTEKVFKGLKFAYENCSSRCDFYLKADDDTFVIVDNLRYFLASKNASRPVTYGYDFNVYVPNGGFHYGGGGYVLTREAAARLADKLNQNYSFYSKKNNFFEYSGYEDLDSGRALRKLNVTLEKSLDSLGRERFHGLSLDTHFTGNFPTWLAHYRPNPVKMVTIASFIRVFY